MKPTLGFALILILANPPDLLADGNAYPFHHSVGLRSHGSLQARDMQRRLDRPARRPFPDIRNQRRGPVRSAGVRKKPGQPSYPGYHFGRPGHGRPPFWRPAGTTVIRETRPIIIVNLPPPAANPPPEPESVWVPSVIETRTEPGYWDYGIRKRWMGDHWRYEQDHGEKIWVPASQVRSVKQEGYWKTVEAE